MSRKTFIQWCHSTWSPWLGCSKVSPGCKECYITTTPALAFRGLKHGDPRQRTSESYWKQPLKWNRDAEIASKGWQAANQLEAGGMPIKGELAKHGMVKPTRPRIFPSLCDWLDDEVPIEWLADFLKLIHDTPNLDWLLLTKRPENWAKRIKAARNYQTTRDADVALWLHNCLPAAETPGMPAREGRPPANIWIGVSTEDQKRADERVPLLLRIPATIRFLSVEPLLGPVDLDKLDIAEKCAECQKQITASAFSLDAHCDCCVEGDEPICWNKLHWVITGGESGPRARACDVHWIRSIVEQCKAAMVPCFVKQLGKHPFEETFEHEATCDNEQCALAGGPDDCAGVVTKTPLQLKHKKGGDPSEWPANLRVQEFPNP